MDPTAVAGMVFVLIILAMIGGFILILPLTRQLGRLLEQRALAQQGAEGAAAEEVRELRAAVEALQLRLEEIAEKQEFTEKLLAERRDLTLPPPR